MFILKKCSVSISKQFTDLTSVINEGNSYEFPSSEIHKAIINKLLFQDKDFAKLFAQLKESHAAKPEAYNAHFGKMVDNFKSIQQDVYKNQINIDHYFRELKKHAREEYAELEKVIMKKGNENYFESGKSSHSFDSFSDDDF